MEMAKQEARAHFDKDEALRIWAASHGGVYVPVDERTPPNPYLSHVPYRDVKLPNGKELTLMNPAYMLRDLLSQHANLYGIRGHITSLKPMGPETAPDGWEKAALEKLEQGSEETFEVIDLEDKAHLRLMRPIYAKEDCLKCHAFQGYKAGDVKGGISVTVPLAPYLERAGRERFIHSLFFGALMLTGLGAIGLAGRTVIREMSRKDEAEHELKKALDALEEQTRKLTCTNEKLRESNHALEEFAQIASHDLQEPLRKIRSFGERLAKRYGGVIGQDGKDYVERMGSASERMQSLIDSLLNYSRVSTKAEPYSSVDLNRVVSEVALDLEARIEQTGGILKVETLPTIYADPAQMRQLFQNLIGNGLKYHRDGVSPVVQVRAVPCEGEQCRIEVEDNGIGFEETYSDRIFAPFFRLHGRSSYEGTGMGLAICKKIVERHGGTITARSTPGEGATFVVKMPLKQTKDKF
jgi:signal transduction histidine kinase